MAPPIFTPILQVWRSEGHEGQSTIHKVRLWVVEYGGWYESLQRLHWHRDVDLGPVAKQHEVTGFARELQVHEVLEGEALLPAHRERRVVGDGPAVHGQDDVAAAEQPDSRGEGHDAAHHHAGVVGAQAVVLAQLAVLQLLPEDSHGAEAGAAAGVLGVHVLQEVLNRGHGDDIADVLGGLLVLEGHADDPILLVQGGPAGVAGVDGRVDLDGQQRGARVRVALDLDA
mmetsp:Transcript_89088/g.276873  ORF Transcript_89088/g.276873 Transcript_89088/m.276873 type:complete len:228 (-) Transcript_89088:406-1089(-)